MSDLLDYYREYWQGFKSDFVVLWGKIGWQGLIVVVFLGVFVAIAAR